MESALAEILPLQTNAINKLNCLHWLDEVRPTKEKE